MEKDSAETSPINKTFSLNQFGSIRIFTAEDIRQLLTMHEAIELMAKAFKGLSEEQYYIPLRYVTEIPGNKLSLIFKPAVDYKSERLAIKILTQNDSNSISGLPSIMGMVMLLDADTGLLLALMDGSHITDIRTGAASGIATKMLARQDSKVAAIFGCGAQGRTQLEAVLSVRSLSRVYAFDTNPQSLKVFIEEMKGRFMIDIQACDDKNVLSEVDIICTATGSESPLFERKHIKPGVHINAIGSYKPFMQEIDPYIIRDSRLFVDSINPCLTESGDIIKPVKMGIIREDHIMGEIGEVITGKKTGRSSENDITIFKSVGVAIQDLVVANHLYDRAMPEKNINT